ncbi:hypothetical protein [Planctomicrobium sp. SH664]|uniref:hypothetical protein n=1 Tax=Planctomicrobium sp. SH664 TaxID=3448125 RepID=UPI003F5B93E7
MSWDGIRGTLQWMLLLFIVGTVAVVAAVFRGWSAKDALIAQGAHEHLSKVFPDSDIEFESVGFTDSTHLQFNQLRFLAKGTRQQLLHIPRAVIEIDGPILQNFHRITISEVTLHNPAITVTRTADNVWNWSSFRVIPPPEDASPRFVLRNGSVEIGLQSERGGEFQTAQCSQINLVLDPEAHQRFQMDLNLKAEGVGPVHVAGLVDNEQGELRLTGQANELHLGEPLFDLVSQFVPRLRHELAKVRATNLALRTQMQRAVPIRTASTSETLDMSLPNSDAPDSQLIRADAAVTFHLERSSESAPFTYHVTADIQNGKISDALLPIPLYNLEGHFDVTPGQIQIQQLKASNGASTLFVDGKLARTEQSWMPNFALRATELQLDQRMRGCLPPDIASVVDMLNPSGTFEVDVSLKQEPGEALQVKLQKFSALDCRAVCDYFRVPVEHIRGDVRQEGKTFHLDMQAEVTGYPITFGGVIQLEEGAPTVLVKVDIPQLPIEPVLVPGLQRDDQKAIRETLQQLRLTGMAKNTVVTVQRSPRTMNKVKLSVEGHLENGTLNYTLFPYEVTDLQAHLVYDGTSRDTWIFDGLQGRHGEARFTGQGAFDLEDGPGQLMLDLSLTHIPLDSDLERAASKACPPLEAIWKDFGIRGIADAQQLEIDWSHATGTQVAVRNIQWKDGALHPKHFPFLWENIVGVLDWENNRLNIRSLNGWHGETYFDIKGVQPGSAFVHLPAASDPKVWQLHFDNLNIAKLNLDDDLKRALPVEITDALKAIDLRSSLELLQLRLDVIGWRGKDDQQPITAAWAARTTLRNNTMNPGIEMTGINGRFEVLNGSWNGKQVQMEGFVELDSLNVLGQPLQRVEGPLQISGDRVLIGTPRFSKDVVIHQENNPHRQKTMKAELYGGGVQLDLEVVLPAGSLPPVYRLELNASNVELAEWAALQNPPIRSVMGKVAAHVEASGRGDSGTATSGTGWVQIMPAALYELPVFAQMFAMPTFRGASNTAFTYADGEFTLRDGKFDFSKIQLWGDLLGLVGKGEVFYAGPNQSQLRFDFYSKANNQTPLLKPLINYLSRDWIWVQVTGTVQNPSPVIQPRIGLLDAAVKDLMGAMEQGAPPKATRLPPTTGGR